jgi:hypothetical protein
LLLIVTGSLALSGAVKADPVDHPGLNSKNESAATTFAKF